MDLFGAATVQLHWFGASVQKNKYQLVVSPCLELLWHCEFTAAFQDTHGHIWQSPQIACSIKKKGCTLHINAFPCFWLKPYIIWGEVESLRHPPSTSFFKLSTFNALKVMIFFLPTCRGSLSGERKRERHCQEMSQLCSTRDLTIPSDLLIFGRRSADIKSKMLLLEKHGAVQTERVQRWGTVT